MTFYHEEHEGHEEWIAERFALSRFTLFMGFMVNMRIVPIDPVCRNYEGSVSL